MFRVSLDPVLFCSTMGFKGSRGSSGEWFKHCEICAADNEMPRIPCSCIACMQVGFAMAVGRSLKDGMGVTRGSPCSLGPISFRPNKLRGW